MTDDFAPGQRVHARRYIQPDLAHGCRGRRLDGEWDGIADGNGGMRILDGQGKYSGQYLCFDYVFLGADVVGGSAYLVTEVDVSPSKTPDVSLANAASRKGGDAGAGA